MPNFVLRGFDMDAEGASIKLTRYDIGMRPLSPKGAALCTAIAALLLSAPLFVAYRASHFWMILVLIALYFGGVIWTLYLQLKHPASALLMMRAFVIPSGVMSIFAALFVWALQGRLHELNLVSR